MLKVLKFGGSSMADEKQFAKVRDIVRADDSRRVVVVSAAGKRDKNDHKITDLLYLCHAHLQYGVSCDGIYDMICSRYVAIRDALGLKTPLEAEFAALREKMDKGISADELVSRGEYFAAELMADYLGFDFLDSSLWLKFKLDGTVDQEASYENLRRAASGSDSKLWRPLTMFSSRFSRLNHWRILLRALLERAIFTQSRLGPWADLLVMTSTTSPLRRW